MLLKVKFQPCIGAHGKFYEIIKNMYKKTKLCVKLDDDNTTAHFHSTVGIRQGDNLSPNLFKLIMNDLPAELEKQRCDPVVLNENPITCLMYADDIVLLSETSEGLQNAINTTRYYGQKQGLEINRDKTKLMYFNQSGKFSKVKLSIDDHTLEEVKEYKYLGITISNSGSLAPARKSIYKSATKALYKLKSMINTMSLSTKTSLHLYDTLITPILLYGCECTNIFNISRKMENNELGFFDMALEQLQERSNLHFCKYILGVNNKAANIAT